jgi:hypothetical protein
LTIKNVIFEAKIEFKGLRPIRYIRLLVVRYF